jgi:S-adenosylmethionine:tRNA ribosyltransferase-isomerase
VSTDPRHISIEDYTYDLPESKIAFHPLAQRDASKLLIYQAGKIEEDIFRNILNHLPANCLLVFNNTKVVEARILFQKPSGGQIEIFCLEPGDEYADVTTAFSQQQKVHWHCLVGGASKWKPGQVLVKKIQQENSTIELFARFIVKKKRNIYHRTKLDPGGILLCRSSTCYRCHSLTSLYQTRC